MSRLAQIEERKIFGDAVAIEEDFFLAAVARLATDQRMLAPRLETGEIGEGAVRLRHARLILLHAAAHLLHEPLLQFPRAGQDRAAIGILRLEMITDAR